MSLSQSLFDLTGKTALVTGGSSGLGAYFAEVLCEAGAKVAIVARRTEKLEEVATLVRSKGGDVRTKTCDIVDAERVAEVVDELWNELGRIDILVNNAGTVGDGGFVPEKLPHAVFGETIQTNLVGLWTCSQEVGKRMLSDGMGGSIINITSVVGLMGNAGQANYAAAKAGVVGFTRSAAKEMASRGITVNAVAPGFIATDMTKDLNAEGILAAIPLGSFGTPEQVAGTVRFLAADPAAAYITGQVIQVDGGMVMG